MATFECKVYPLTIEEHPNADALELAVVGDYRSIVRKGQFKTGDLGVYIPTNAVVPEWLLRKMGLWDNEKGKGKLAGKNGNRVKEIRLRGILSEGLVYPVERSVPEKGITNAIKFFDGGDHHLVVQEGQDVTTTLGITKYEPPIPTQMAGEVFNAHGYTLSYDIENIKKYPNVIVEDEDVVFTEKLHGSWCCFGFHPKVDSLIVTSKGLSGRGLAFKLNEANEKNVYIRALSKTADDRGYNIIDRASDTFGGYHNAPPFYILGEVYGPGIQDLTYGADEIQFRVFDVYSGNPGQGSFLDDDELEFFCANVNVERVPVLYRGLFNKEIMETYTNGTETVSGKRANIREGIIITPSHERRDPEIGRVKLKSVSEAYLLRKNATEYN